MRNILAACIFLLALSGCAIVSNEELDYSSGYWFKYKSDERGAYLLVVNSTTHYRVCAEPSPDTIKTLQTSNSMNIDAKDLDPAKFAIFVNSSVSTSATDLARRSQSLQLLRDMLFGLCELTVNSNLSPGQVENMYLGIVNAVSDMFDREIEYKMAEAQMRSAIANTIAAEAQKQQAIANTVQAEAELKKQQAALETLKAAGIGQKE